MQCNYLGVLTGFTLYLLQKKQKDVISIPNANCKFIQVLQNFKNLVSLNKKEKDYFLNFQIFE